MAPAETDETVDTTKLFYLPSATLLWWPYAAQPVISPVGAEEEKKKIRSLYL
ncbi:hypothetical protein [Mucilaginibacter sp.]|uniref:hypothetical protein n=1 Tax=Mucilaginibacter sp. TaxID=1882438 RepID=UPI00374D9828